MNVDVTTASKKNAIGNVGRRAALSEDVQKRIGEQLRAMFEDVVEEPIPERLLKVLEKLQSKEKK